MPTGIFTAELANAMRRTACATTAPPATSSPTNPTQHSAAAAAASCSSSEAADTKLTPANDREGSSPAKATNCPEALLSHPQIRVRQDGDRHALLKLLHFAALLCWCGSLLSSGDDRRRHKRSEQLFYRDHAHLTRMVFTLISTPAALLAIGSGTALFLRDGTLAGWLIMKLTVVTAMALCHALCGVLVLRIEREPGAASHTSAWHWVYWCRF